MSFWLQPLLIGASPWVESPWFLPSVVALAVAIILVAVARKLVNRNDSPWLWLGVFAVMAIAGVVVVGPKYGKRRAGIDQNYQGRLRGWRNQMGDKLQPATKDERTGANGALLAAVVAGGAIAVFTLAYVAFRNKNLPDQRATSTRPDERSKASQRQTPSGVDSG